MSDRRDRTTPATASNETAPTADETTTSSGDGLVSGGGGPLPGGHASAGDEAICLRPPTAHSLAASGLSGSGMAGLMISVASPDAAGTGALGPAGSVPVPTGLPAEFPLGIGGRVWRSSPLGLGGTFSALPPLGAVAATIPTAGLPAAPGAPVSKAPPCAPGSSGATSPVPAPSPKGRSSGSRPRSRSGARPSRSKVKAAVRASGGVDTPGGQSALSRAQFPPPLPDPAVALAARHAADAAEACAAAQGAYAMAATAARSRRDAARLARVHAETVQEERGLEAAKAAAARRRAATRISEAADKESLAKRFAAMRLGESDLRAWFEAKASTDDSAFIKEGVAADTASESSSGHKLNDSSAPSGHRHFSPGTILATGQARRPVGLVLRRGTGQWCVQVWFGSRTHTLGEDDQRFIDPSLAARARDLLCLHLRGAAECRRAGGAREGSHENFPGDEDRKLHLSYLRSTGFLHQSDVGTDENHACPQNPPLTPAAITTIQAEMERAQGEEGTNDSAMAAFDDKVDAAETEAVAAEAAAVTAEAEVAAAADRLRVVEREAESAAASLAAAKRMAQLTARKLQPVGDDTIPLRPLSPLPPLGPPPPPGLPALSSLHRASAPSSEWASTASNTDGPSSSAAPSPVPGGGRAAHHHRRPSYDRPRPEAISTNVRPGLPVEGSPFPWSPGGSGHPSSPGAIAGHFCGLGLGAAIVPMPGGDGPALTPTGRAPVARRSRRASVSCVQSAASSGGERAAGSCGGDGRALGLGVRGGGTASGWALGPMGRGSCAPSEGCVAITIPGSAWGGGELGGGRLSPPPSPAGYAAAAAAAATTNATQSQIASAIASITPRRSSGKSRPGVRSGRGSRTNSGYATEAAVNRTDIDTQAPTRAGALAPSLTVVGSKRPEGVADDHHRAIRFDSATDALGSGSLVPDERGALVPGIGLPPSPSPGEQGAGAVREGVLLPAHVVWQSTRRVSSSGQIRMSEDGLGLS